MADHDKQHVEERLRERAEELRRTRSTLGPERDGIGSDELSNLDNHPADDATETHEQEVEATTEVFLEEEERRIAEARQALEEGTYGTCLDCRREIPAERLTAMPEAVRCIDCQRGFEGEHRQANGP